MADQSMKMDWENILRLKKMPELADCCSAPEHLRANLYRLGKQIYAFADQQFDETLTREAFFVNQFYWAPTPAVFDALVMCSRDFEVGDTASLESVPSELLLSPECRTYGNCIYYVRQQGIEHFDETEVFPKEDFEALYIAVSVEELTYYFVGGLPIEKASTPFAMSRSMRNDLWGV